VQGEGLSLTYQIDPGDLTTGGRDCTYSGAGFTSKKTLISAQNIENKGSKFFLPSRSMVLKVVTGKIFKTLQLRCLPMACGSVLGNCKFPLDQS